VEVITSLAQWRERTDSIRSGPATLGVTLTMGALHPGHAALFEASRGACDVSVATIFVNPLQFNDAQDLAAYPRDLDADLARCEAGGIAVVLVPSVAEIWPDWPEPTSTRVHVEGLADRLEGADRPGHFDGVATVVSKLLIATGRCTAFFGEKDFQQLCVVRRVVADLAIDADVVGVGIVREPDGLALSSRNVRLSAPARAEATVLHRALEAGRAALEAGATPAKAVAAMEAVVAAVPAMSLAYARVVEEATLDDAVEPAAGTTVRLLAAGVIDSVRLIDNLAAVVGAAADPTVTSGAAR
jgi:pantoate--beta-alanine ligase